MNIIEKLSNTVIKKFIDSVSLKNWQVMSDEGWVDIKSINLTVPYKKYIIKTEKYRLKLECADNHILIKSNGEEIFAKDSLGEYVKTKYGDDMVIYVLPTDDFENMYDLELADDSKHVYYTNDILSHNTTLLTIEVLWYTLFNNDKTVLIISNKEDTSEEILSRVRLAYQELPIYLKSPIITWQQQTIKFQNGSKIKISATSANAARGLSVNLLAVDECAIIDEYKAKDFFKAVLPTISSSKKSKIILTSTPKGTDNYFARVVKEARTGKSPWKTMSIPWNLIPGRDDEWRELAMADCDNDIHTFRQEYCCEFLDEGTAAIDKTFLSELKSLTYAPEILDTEDYKVWEAPDPNHIYSMGVDVSDGVGECASCVQVVDITDLTAIRQVACYNNRFIDPSNFAKEISEIAKQWGNPWILIERNNMGSETISTLEKEPFYYERLVSYDVKDKTDYSKHGVVSSTNVKYEGVSNMRYYMNTLKVLQLPDKETINEFETFVKHPNGTFKKTSGPNIYDDRVMALCWALFILHVPVANVCLDVQELDTNGKPLLVRKSWDDTGKGLYQMGGIISDTKDKNEEFFNPYANGFFSGKNTQSLNDMNMFDLIQNGWSRI